MNVLAWWLDASVTPVLIPNTEVKPRSADDSRKAKVGSRQTKIFNFYFIARSVTDIFLLKNSATQPRPAKRNSGLAKLQVFASHPLSLAPPKAG